jgi:hypothetical protein
MKEALLKIKFFRRLFIMDKNIFTNDFVNGVNDDFYKGEPKINKQTFKERTYYVKPSHKEMNQYALKVQEMKEKGMKYHDSYEYYELLRPFYGPCGFRNGVPAKNFVQTHTERIWHIFRDETIFSDQLWKNFEYTIEAYDPHYNFEESLRENARNQEDKDDVKNFNSLCVKTAHRLAAKQKNDLQRYKSKSKKSNFPKEVKYSLNEEIYHPLCEEDTLGDILVEDWAEELATKGNFYHKEKVKFIVKLLPKGYSQSDIAYLMEREFGTSYRTNLKFLSRTLEKLRVIVEQIEEYEEFKYLSENKKKPKTKKKQNSENSVFYDVKAFNRNKERKEKYEEFTQGTEVKTYKLSPEELEALRNK